MPLNPSFTFKIEDYCDYAFDVCGLHDVDPKSVVLCDPEKTYGDAWWAMKMYCFDEDELCSPNLQKNTKMFDSEQEFNNHIKKLIQDCKAKLPNTACYSICDGYWLRFKDVGNSG